MPFTYLLAGNIKGFLISLLLILPALFIAVSFHEAAHAWMANKMGDPTAKNLGRLTLDPLKHFSLLGFLSFAMIGFGWGKPVPTNPRNYYNYKKGNVLVALSGVTVNLIITVVTTGIIALMYYLNALSAVTVDTMRAMSNIPSIVLWILYEIAFLNLVLCFFNLIPIPPLDGHHLVKGYIARKNPRFYMLYNQYGYLFLLVLLFFITPFRQGFTWLIMAVFKGIVWVFGLSGFFASVLGI